MTLFIWPVAMWVPLWVSIAFYHTTTLRSRFDPQFSSTSPEKRVRDSRGAGEIDEGKANRFALSKSLTSRSCEFHYLSALSFTAITTLLKRSTRPKAPNPALGATIEYGRWGAAQQRPWNKRTDLSATNQHTSYLQAVPSSQTERYAPAASQ